MIFQLTILFTILMASLAMGMLIHTYQSRKKIFRNFQRLSSIPGAVKGEAVQKSVFAFPSFEGAAFGKKISAFFHIAEGKQTSVIYFTSTMEVKAAFSIFLKKEHFYRAVQGARLDKNAGIPVPDIDPRFEIRSHDVEKTRQYFKDPRVIKRLSDLENYPAVQIGPDAVIISKPYDGIKDSRPEAVIGGFEILKDLADALESLD